MSERKSRKRDGGCRRHRGDDHECRRHEAPADAALRRLADSAFVVRVRGRGGDRRRRDGRLDLVRAGRDLVRERGLFRTLSQAGVRGLTLRLDVGERERVRFDRFPADLRGRYDDGVVYGGFVGALGVRFFTSVD